MESRVEDNENLTYSYIYKNEEGNSLTQPQEIPSHENLTIHTTQSEILGEKRKRRKKIKNLTNYRKKFLTY